MLKKKINLIRLLSHYRRPTSIVSSKSDELREKYFPKDGTISSPAFSVLRTVLMQSIRHLNNANIDAAVIGLMSSGDNLVNARKYLNYLDHQQEIPSKMFLSKLLKLYNSTAKTRKLESQELEEIQTIYSALRKDFEYLDSSLCENLIYGISLTENWREGLELLEETRLSAVPSTGSYCALASKAFEDESTFSIAWKILEEIVEERKEPKCEVFTSFLNTIKRTENFKKHLEQMFDFIGKNELQVSRQVILKLRDILTEREIKNFVTKISEKGHCDICQTKLSHLQLMDREFNELQKHFLQSVLIRDDVFQKSSPDEVNLFLKIINKSQPYDCVIDGLNVVYSSGTNKNPKVYSAILSSVVKYFKDKDKRVLIIGRKHMLKWKTPAMLFVKKNADIFYTGDLSQDDPFLLFAALKSGINTDFLSRDLMRSHSYLLNNELKTIFKRWQQIHQYSLVTTSGGMRGDQVIVRKPFGHCNFAHKIGKGSWHIPFREKYMSNPPESFGSPDNWLCVQLE
ncbi:KIAA0391 family protein [Megaselia abdita]